MAQLPQLTNCPPNLLLLHLLQLLLLLLSPTCTRPHPYIRSIQPTPYAARLGQPIPCAPGLGQLTLTPSCCRGVTKRGCGLLQRRCHCWSYCQGMRVGRGSSRCGGGACSLGSRL